MVQGVKRSRPVFDASVGDRSPDCDECDSMLDQLSEDSVRKIIKELVQDEDMAELRWAIKSGFDQLQGNFVDTDYWLAKARKAFPSAEEQCSWGRHGSANAAPKVERKIGELVNECMLQLPAAQAFCAVTAVIEGAQCDGYEEGLGKELWQYGLSSEMAGYLEGILDNVPPEEYEQLSGAIANLQRMHKAMDDFGMDEFGDIVELYEALKAKDANRTEPAVNAKPAAKKEKGKRGNKKSECE